MHLRKKTLGLCGLCVLVAVSAGVAQSRYDVSRAGDVVTLSDTESTLVVRVLTTASNAYQVTVKGEDVIRRTWNTLDDIELCHDDCGSSPGRPSYDSAVRCNNSFAGGGRAL